MTDDDFEARFEQLQLTAMSASLIEEFADGYAALLVEVQRDLKAAGEDLDLQEVQLCKERLKGMRGLVIRQTEYVARLYRDRIEEGKKQSEGN